MADNESNIPDNSQEPDASLPTRPKTLEFSVGQFKLFSEEELAVKAAEAKALAEPQPKEEPTVEVKPESPDPAAIPEETAPAQPEPPKADTGGITFTSAGPARIVLNRDSDAITRPTPGKTAPPQKPQPVPKLEDIKPVSSIQNSTKVEEHVATPSKSRTLRKFLSLPLIRIALYLLLALLISGVLAICRLPFATFLETHLRLQNYVNSTIQMIAALAAMWIMVRFVEHGNINDSGYSPLQGGRNLFMGFGIGIGAIVVIFATLSVSYIYDPGSFNQNYSLFAPFLACCTIAIAEETIFRGYILRTLDKRYGSLVGIVVTCTLVALLRYFNGTPSPVDGSEKLIESLFLALGEGLVLSSAYIATRSLWTPIGLHVACAFLVGPIFGINAEGAADSLNSVRTGMCNGPFYFTGGDFGPEASLPALIVFAIIAGFLISKAVTNGKWVKYSDAKAAWDEQGRNSQTPDLS